MRRFISLSMLAPLFAMPLQAGVAAEPVVRKAPYDAGSMCAQHAAVYYQNVYTTCLYSPTQGNNPSDPLDPVTFQFNYLAFSAQMGILVGGGYHYLYAPPLPQTYVYNIKRSQSIVYFTSPSAGTLTVSSDIRYAVASFPVPRAYRTCMEAYDVTPGRGAFPFTGHVLKKNDCAYEDQSRTHFSFSVYIFESMPIALEAVLDNSGDNGAATGVVDNITYTFTAA